MDQGRHVDELDRGRGADRGGAALGAGAEQDQQRPQALAPRRERRPGVGGEQLAVPGDLLAQQILDLAEPRRQPAARGIEHRGDRGRYGGAAGHPAMPV